MVAPLRPTAGTRFGIYRGGTGTDHGRQTIVPDETDQETGRRTVFAVGSASTLGRRHRLYRHETGAIGRLARSDYGGDRPFGAAADGGETKADPSPSECARTATIPRTWSTATALDGNRVATNDPSPCGHFDAFATDEPDRQHIVPHVF